MPLSASFVFGVGLAVSGLVADVARSFTLPPATASLTLQRPSSRLFSMPDDPYPSDYDADDLESAVRQVAVDTVADDASIRDELKRELILLASVTNRGMCASAEEENLVSELVSELEGLNP